MSWWVRLEEPGTDELFQVKQHSEGGTYMIGGTDESELNITYNYGVQFCKAWPEDFSNRGALQLMLDERSGEETLPLLLKAIKLLGTDRTRDYWAATPGNAGFALDILAKWAKQHPQGVWRVS